MRWQRQLATGARPGGPGEAFALYFQCSTPHNQPQPTIPVLSLTILKQISTPHLFLFPFVPPRPLPEMALATSDSQEGPAFLCQEWLSPPGCLQAPCLTSQVRIANWL